MLLFLNGFLKLSIFYIVAFVYDCYHDRELLYFFKIKHHAFPFVQKYKYSLFDCSDVIWIGTLLCVNTDSHGGFWNDRLTFIITKTFFFLSFVVKTYRKYCPKRIILRIRKHRKLSHRICKLIFRIIILRWRWKRRWICPKF